MFSIQKVLKKIGQDIQGFATRFLNIENQIQTILSRLGVDYIVEQGTSGIWTYEKRNSGKLICKARQRFNMSMTYGIASYLQTTTGVYEVALPTVLVGAPTNISSSARQPNNPADAALVSAQIQNNKFRISCISWGIAGTRLIEVDLLVEGLWKAIEQVGG